MTSTSLLRLARKVFIATLLMVPPLGNHVARSEERPNILLILIDDLNDYVGCLGGHPDAHTPHIDALAKSGVLFTNAHCNSPVCNPSRASIWTGLRPTTTEITTNHSGWFRDHPSYQNVKTLPQTLSENGYSTSGFGKLFHLGHGNKPWPDWQQSKKYGYGPLLKTHMAYREGDGLSDWGTPPRNQDVRRGPKPTRLDMASFDPDIAQRIINFLGDEHDRPFFLGCGFYRPHTPLYAPERWFARFPLEKISLPEIKKGDLDDLPYFQNKPRREQDIEAPGLWNHDWVVSHGKWKEIVQAYLASTSSADEQVGRVIRALRQSKFAENTFVVLCSDHGWHLGEKEHWGKAALWEQTTRVPLIVSGPGIPQGLVCDEPVELLSLYPTIVDYASATSPAHLEGVSLRPLLEESGDWNHAALTTFSDHHALRTKHFRYIRYEDGSEELYDHRNDPNEWTNLAPSPPSVIEELRKQMNQLLP